MVNTRSGFNRESRLSREEMNEYSGDEDNMSVVDHFAENVNGNEDLNDMREIERDHEKHRIEQRFMEINRQISELTSIVRALTDKMSNSREENYRDAHKSETSVRSDTKISGEIKMDKFYRKETGCKFVVTVLFGCFSLKDCRENLFLKVS